MFLLKKKKDNLLTYWWGAIPCSNNPTGPCSLRHLFSSFRSALPPSILRSLPPTDCWSLLPVLSPLRQPQHWSHWWGWVSPCSIIYHPPSSSVIFRKHTPDSQAKGLHCNKGIWGLSQDGPPSGQQSQVWSLPSLSVPREPETCSLFAQLHSRDPHTLGKGATPLLPHSWHYCTHMPALFISTRARNLQDQVHHASATTQSPWLWASPITWSFLPK